MTLAELKTGDKAAIVKVNGHGSFRKRLVEMGFISGKTVKAILAAPMKDPVEYEIMGYRLSLRREEAAMIEVIGEEEARQALKEAGVIPPIDAEDYEAESLEAKMEALAIERKNVIRVALVGNPNCGKTSLFNIASGSHERVGNYSGVTVDAKEGRFEYKGYRFIIVDLPGTYSMSAYSPEELYVRKNLVEHIPDVVINVVDASNLERNLYLTTQIIDMNLRTVLALNMYDELQAKGDSIDTHQLGWLLGVPVRPTVCRDGRGIEELFDTVISVYTKNDPQIARHIHINHGIELERSIDRIKLLLQENDSLRAHYSTRFLAIKYLENDSQVAGVIAGLSNAEAIARARGEEEKRIRELLGSNTESAIVDAKYAFIQGALAETYTRHKGERPLKTVTDRIDSIVTNQWLAFPVFIAMLYIVFQATFTLGNYPMEWIEWLVARFSDAVGEILPAGWLKDLVTDGIISGVGSVLVFLPNILILYFFISLMEDSGYMARAAFIMDRMMHRIGLHGKSFIPMIMGFGCNVPAIMATRTIESRKSRLITIALIPFMSCSGRLPIFVLLTGAFFPGREAAALLGIYLLGILLAIFSSIFLRRFIKDDDLPFVMELPPYRVPTGKAIWRHTWEKGRQYLEKMATTILIGSVAVWMLGYFPRSTRLAEATGRYTDISARVDAAGKDASSVNPGEDGSSAADAAGNPAALEALIAEKAAAAQQVNDLYAAQQENSYIGRLGQAVAPALDPLGFNWKMDIGLLTGVVAKELVVSTLGVMYSQGAAVIDSDEDAMASDTGLQDALAGSIPLPAAVAFMIFILLYFPCIATFVAIKNETGKWSWAVAICAYTMAIAWIAAFIGAKITALFI